MLAITLTWQSSCVIAIADWSSPATPSGSVYTCSCGAQLQLNEYSLLVGKTRLYGNNSYLNCISSVFWVILIDLQIHSLIQCDSWFCVVIHDSSRWFMILLWFSRHCTRFGIVSDPPLRYNFLKVHHATCSYAGARMTPTFVIIVISSFSPD